MNVIKSVKHGDGVVTINEKNITITVDYGYTGTVNVKQLDIQWDSVGYNHKITTWGEGAETVGVGAGSVAATVTYSNSDESTSYSSEYSISVERGEKTPPSVSGDISKKGVSGAMVTFGSGELEQPYKRNDGGALSKIAICGTAGDSVSFQVGGTTYTLGTDIEKLDLDSVSFKATATGTYTYRVEYYESGKTDCIGTATLTITVENPTLASVSAASVNYNETASFPTEKLNEVYKAAGGEGSYFDHIVFSSLASTGVGKLYANYENSSLKTGVTMETEYGVFELGKMKFVPATSSSATASYDVMVYDSRGIGYKGKVIFTVKSSALDQISVSINKDETYTGFSSDIYREFRELTGKTLSYVEFTNASSVKYLYDSNDDRMTSTSREFLYNTTTTSKKLSKVYFKPYNDDDVTIKYTAYDNNDKAYSGTVKVTVKSAADLNTITYTGKKDETVRFDVDDFKSVLGRETSRNLDYVKFTLPSSSRGVLYYNGTSTSKGTKATSSTKFYRTGTGKNLLDDVTFVPASSYTGTVTINYTATDTSDYEYTGIVKINVGTTDSLSRLSYTINNMSKLTISASDINTKFKSAAGESFDYLKFTLPSSGYGLLYYDYTSASSYDSLVKASGEYYRTGSTAKKSVDKVTFVPKSGFTGTFDLKYTAYDSDENPYEGVLRITVTQGQIDKSAYFKDVNADYAWAAAKIDYLYKEGVVKGTGSGTEMYYSPAAQITRGDFMLMLYRSFDLSGTVTENFSDVLKDSYYYTAIGVAKKLGIAQGAYGKFNPAESLTRQDAMVLLNRAIDVTGRKNLTASTDLSKFSDRAKVASYAKEAVGTLVRAGVLNGYENGTFLPEGKLTRAEMAIVLYNVEML